MIETLAVFQLATSWLKAFAELNVCEHPTRSKPHRSRAPKLRHPDRARERGAGYGVHRASRALKRREPSQRAVLRARRGRCIAAAIKRTVETIQIRQRQESIRHSCP